MDFASFLIALDHVADHLVHRKRYPPRSCRCSRSLETGQRWLVYLLRQPYRVRFQLAFLPQTVADNDCGQIAQR
jgi:hypothetical protein